MKWDWITTHGALLEKYPEFNDFRAELGRVITVLGLDTSDMSDKNQILLAAVSHTLLHNYTGFLIREKAFNPSHELIQEMVGLISVFSTGFHSLSVHMETGVSESRH